MKILITGSSGFIGKHLKEYLLNNSTYTIFNPSHKELDLLNENSVDNYISKIKPDVIINCANIGGGRDSGNENIVHKNIRMFFNIAKQSTKVHKIINFGSGAEYSKHKPIINAFEDDANIQLPLDEYGFYKSVVSKFIEKSDNIINLRIFGCYGEYENYLFKFISNAIVKNIFHLPIVINRNVYFDYIYINDLMKIVDYFIKNDGKYKIYNASTGVKIDLLTLAKIINESSSFKSEIVILNEGLNDEYTSNNEKLLNEISDFRFTSHKDAIMNMRDYFLSFKDKLDLKTIQKDPYLKKCNNFWKTK